MFNGLLGLLFWDIIFQPVAGAFANRFQRAPLDLYEPEFALRRQPAIEQRLVEIRAGQALLILEQHQTQKHGLANTLVHWDFFAQLPWRQILEVLPPPRP